MPRPYKLIPSRKICVFLDEPEAAKLDLLLYSPSLGRVEHGGYKRFVQSAIREALDFHILDLAPFTGAMPGTYLVKGEPEAMRVLEGLLKGKGE